MIISLSGGLAASRVEVYSGEEALRRKRFHHSNSLLLAGFLALLPLIGQAQINQTNAPAVTNAAGYSVVELGPHQRIWERATPWMTNEAGEVEYVTNRVTELATGMNKLVNGQYVPATENITITADGGLFSGGQTELHLLSNINSSNAIDMMLSDSNHLTGNCLGLSYYDYALQTNVLFAQVKDCTGQVVGSNQVIYSDCFTSILGSIRYTYRRLGVEQDILISSQLPDPAAAFGLNPATTRLQVTTEFYNPPAPQVQPLGDNGDSYLNFGAAQMGSGRAFFFGSESNSVPVRKEWVSLPGRSALIEEIDFGSVAAQLQTLPPAPGGTNGPNAALRIKGFPGRLPPPVKFAKQGPSGGLKIAKTAPTGRALVLDYQAVNSSTNFTFQGDSTYFVSSAVTLSGTTTIEGDTVIKFTNSSSAQVTLNGPLVSLTAPYRMAVLTSQDDCSVGDTVTTNTPTNTHAVYLIGSSLQTNDYQYLRMAFAGVGVSNSGPATVWHSQFVQCGTAVASASTSTNGAITLRNVLIANATNCVSTTGSVIAEHLTGDQVQMFCALTNYTGASVTNSIVAGVTNQAGITNAAYSVTNGSGLFQVVSAGSYYLVTGSVYRIYGTTNINTNLLSALKNKTTYQPTVLSNLTVAVNTTLFQQAIRNTNTSPDIGFCYDPLDYLVHVYAVTNATLTVMSGVAIASDNNNGSIWLQDGSTLTAVGTPTAPCWFTRYSLVQEQPLSVGGSANSGNIFVNSSHFGSVGPNATFQFCKFSCPSKDGYHLYDSSSSDLSSLVIEDSELYSAQVLLGGYTNADVTTVNNNLFQRTSIDAEAGASSAPTLSFTNNLVWGTSVKLAQPSTTPWNAFNNSFDTCSFSRGCTLTNGYNAYINCSGFGGARLNPTNAYDIVTNAFTYQSGPLGNFYQTTNSPLLNKGSTNAGLLGLFWFTTETNEVPESNAIVTIGYHYVAVDSNGNPLDSNGNGIPDYLENPYGSVCQADPSGIIDWWPGESNTVDVVGPLTQTSVNGVTYTNGEVNYAFKFNGTNQYLTNMTPGITNVNNNFTYEFWAYPTGARSSTTESTTGIPGISGQRYAIFPNWGGTSGPAGVGVSVGTNGVSVFEHADTYMPSILVFNTNIVGWTHIAIVEVNQQPKLYLNGVLVHTGLTSTRAYSYISTCLGEIGLGYGYYSGLLDEVTLYNRSLSATEVLAIYNAGPQGKCDGSGGMAMMTDPNNIGPTALQVYTPLK